MLVSEGSESRIFENGFDGDGGFDGGLLDNGRTCIALASQSFSKGAWISVKIGPGKVIYTVAAFSECLNLTGAKVLYDRLSGISSRWLDVDTIKGWDCLLTSVNSVRR